MKKININFKNYKIPTDWSEIQFDKFRRLEANQSVLESLKDNDKALCLIKILTDIPDKKILNLKEKTKVSILQFISYALNRNISEVKNSFFMLKGKYYYFEHGEHNINIGQYIDWCMITKNTNSPLEVSHKIAAILIRPVKAKNKLSLFWKKLRNKPITKNDFIIPDYNSEQIEELSNIFFKSLPVHYIHTANLFFNELNKKLQTIYERLYQQDSTPEETNGVRLKPDQTRLSAYNEKWNWYILLKGLAKDDLTRFDEVSKINLWVVFNDLGFAIETADIQKEYKK